MRKDDLKTYNLSKVQIKATVYVFHKTQTKGISSQSNQKADMYSTAQN